jgi:hypothetical protein
MSMPSSSSAHGRFYGAYVALRDPATWITHAAIASFDAAHPDPPVLDWYPAEADGSVRGGGLVPVFHWGDRPCFAPTPASARARRRPKCSA